MDRAAVEPPAPESAAERPAARGAEQAAVVAIAAWSGFFVMSVELLSGRILAPHFGSSIYVWGGVITVFMLALSIGYLLGGQWSLRGPSLGRLAALQLAAAATLVPVLLYGEAVLDRLFDVVEDPRAGSLLASSILFLVPTTLSGMISPYGVRLLVERAAVSGRASGFLFFFSTFGSAAGTLLTSFWLVLVLEIDQILLGLIAGSLVVSLGAWALARATRQRRALAGAALAALAALAAAPPPAAAATVLHREKSLYRDVIVTEDAGLRCLTFSLKRPNRQSCIRPAEPDRLVLDYTRLMLAGLYLKPDARRVLVVGLGGGILPRTLEQLLPAARIDSVEIDPAVAAVAERWFLFRPSARSTVTVADGRVHVKRAARAGLRYDLVFLDAYDHEYIPEHLLTREFLAEVRSVLAPGGVVVANTFSRSRLYDAESATYAAAFGGFQALEGANRIVVAADGPLPPAATVRERAAAWDARLRRFGVESEWVLGHWRERPAWDRTARVLTDQYSPSNLLNRAPD